MTHATIQTTCLFAALAVASATDIRSHKVYNWLTYPAAALALGLGACGGWNAFLCSLTGFGAGLALGLATMIFLRMGAGDAKLLAVIGAFAGAAFLAEAAMYGALAGAPIALWLMWRRGVLAYTLRNMATNAMVKAAGATSVTLADNSRAGRMPYAVPIALGAVIAALARSF